MKLIEMNSQEFMNLLDYYSACQEAKLWAYDKTAEEVINTCYRGDWLLWLYKKVSNDLQILTLAKGHCANTVRHIMKDNRSINAVDAAINFGEGKISIKELAAAAADAAAAYAAYAAADAAAAYAAYAAADDAADAADAAAAAAAAAAADAAAADAWTKNRLLTANICRKYLNFSYIEISI